MRQMHEDSRAQCSANLIPTSKQSVLLAVNYGPYNWHCYLGQSLIGGANSDLQTEYQHVQYTENPGVLSSNQYFKCVQNQFYILELDVSSMPKDFNVVFGYIYRLLAKPMYQRYKSRKIKCVGSARSEKIYCCI